MTESIRTRNAQGLIRERHVPHWRPLCAWQRSHKTQARSLVGMHQDGICSGETHIADVRASVVVSQGRTTPNVCFISGTLNTSACFVDETPFDPIPDTRRVGVATPRKSGCSR